MNMETLKEGISSFWDNLAEGWRHLAQTATNALTRFKPSAQANLPAENEVDDSFYMPTRSWAMLGGDVFEDENRLVVRVEIPGMEKEDIEIEVLDDALMVSGEKRFSRESSEGRWRVMQCAYGSFRRVVPLPMSVKADEARAAYRNGVLRVELPKAAPGKPRSVAIKVE